MKKSFEFLQLEVSVGKLYIRKTSKSLSNFEFKGNINSLI
jgi:hypothetical protein